MNILIKSATIIDPKSEFHNTTQDILVENGVITQVASSIKNPKKYQSLYNIKTFETMSIRYTGYEPAREGTDIIKSMTD